MIREWSVNRFRWFCFSRNSICQRRTTAAMAHHRLISIIAVSIWLSGHRSSDEFQFRFCILSICTVSTRADTHEKEKNKNLKFSRTFDGHNFCIEIRLFFNWLVSLILFTILFAVVACHNVYLQCRHANEFRYIILLCVDTLVLWFRKVCGKIHGEKLIIGFKTEFIFNCIDKIEWLTSDWLGWVCRDLRNHCVLCLASTIFSLPVQFLPTPNAITTAAAALANHRSIRVFERDSFE